jgi:uncharacterized protein YdhG (YjbR/CyaY superfamily)
MVYPKIFEQYIQHAPSKIQTRLKKIFQIFSSHLKDANLVMSYQMPTFKRKKNLVHLAFYEHHLGIYPGPQGIIYLLTIFPEAITSKGAWRILHKDSLPVHALNTLAVWIQDQS